MSAEIAQNLPALALPAHLSATLRGGPAWGRLGLRSHSHLEQFHSIAQMSRIITVLPAHCPYITQPCTIIIYFTSAVFYKPQNFHGNRDQQTILMQTPVTSLLITDSIISIDVIQILNPNNNGQQQFALCFQHIIQLGRFWDKTSSTNVREWA